MTDAKDVEGILWKRTPNGKYWVSEFGDITNYKTGYELKLGTSPSGYLKSPIGVLGYNSSVHRVVYIVFMGDIPEGLQINHKDGDKTNNHITNLETCTASENVRHAHAMGLTNPSRGEDHSCSVLAEDRIKEVYSMIKMGMNNMEIERRTMIPFKNVSQLRTGARWKCLFEREDMEYIPSLNMKGHSLEESVYIYNKCLASPKSQDELGLELGIHPPQVSRIRTGKTWRRFRSFFGVPPCTPHWKNQRHALTVKEKACTQSTEK